MDNKQEKYKKHVKFCMRNAFYGINPNIKETEKRLEEFENKVKETHKDNKLLKNI